MIKCNFGTVEICGDRSRIMAELSTLIIGIREAFEKNGDTSEEAKDRVRKALVDGMKDRAELEKEMEESGFTEKLNKALEKLIEAMKEEEKKDG